MPARPLPRLALNLLIALLAFLLSLTALELIVRQFYYPVDSPFNHRIPDPTLGWRLEPNVRFTNQTTEFRVRVAYNSRGWRDVEHRLNRPENVFRIVVVGDSFMEAYSVELADSFARQLERMIRASGRENVEVINLGVGGYGTLQEYLAFVEEGLLYDPDLVLVGFYVANDVRNNSYELESLASGGDSLKVRSRPFLEPGGSDDWQVTLVDYEGARQRFEERRREQEARPWWQKTALYLLYEEGLQRRGQPPADPDRPERWVIPGYDRRVWLGVHMCEEPPEYTDAWRLTERILARFNDDAEAAGARLVVFTVPAWHEVDPDYMALVLSTTGEREAYCLESAPGYDRLGAVLAQYDIPLIDLLPAFRDTLRSGHQRLFRTSDRHWNASGHALAAWEVYQALDAEGLLPPPE
ncbi:MAG TPA: hypothetical protein ENI95_08025 [Chloroflexi bacterium]|nr:hypothetical protein [Chloroflexota bacterium]